MSSICCSCKEEANQLYTDTIIIDPFVVVGMRFRGNHKFKKYDNVTLEFEPTNQYDENAIKVMVDGIHQGYVAKDNNKHIGSLMRRYPKYHISTHGRINYNLSAKLVFEYSQNVCKECYDWVQGAKIVGIYPSVL
jgi:hypothetical protein